MLRTRHPLGLWFLGWLLAGWLAAAGAACAEDAEMKAVPPGTNDPDFPRMVPEPGATSDGTVGVPWYTPTWTLGVGAEMLNRGGPAQMPVALQLGGGPLASADAGQGFAAGPMLSLTGAYEKFDAEFLFFDIDGWNVGRSAVVPLYPFGTLAQGAASYGSKLFNAELNLKFHMHERLNALVGVRWLQLDDRMSLLALDPSANVGGLDAGTLNVMTGVQTGLDGKLWVPDPAFHLDGFFKAGMYSNERHFWTGTALATGLPAPDSQFTTAFAGGLGLSLHWQIVPKFGAFGGYELLWLDGVALAPDFTRTGSPTSNTLFYHGATVGGTWSW